MDLANEAAPILRRRRGWKRCRTSARVGAVVERECSAPIRTGGRRIRSYGRGGGGLSPAEAASLWSASGRLGDPAGLALATADLQAGDLSSFTLNNAVACFIVSDFLSVIGFGS